MKILMAVNQLPAAEVGGVGLYSAHLAGALCLEGHELLLLGGTEQRGPGPSHIEEVEPAAPGVRTVRLVRKPHPPARGGVMGDLVTPDEDQLLMDMVKDFAPDLVHVQHTLQLSNSLPMLARKAGAAVVATVHDYWPICQRITLTRGGAAPGELPCKGPGAGARCALCVSHGSAAPPLLAAARTLPYLMRTQLIRASYTLAHLVTCPSEDTVRRLAANGFDPRRMIVVDYGIPPIPPAVATAPRPAEPLRLGYLGSLGPHKGVHVALRAMERLAHQPVTLIVRGGPLRDPDLRRELDRAQEMGLARYEGPYTEHDLPAVLAGLDALVIPSLWPETGPMVWMEAVSAGLPVIASSVGALPERVRHGRDGLLVLPGDPAALAHAVKEMMSSYDSLRRGVMARTVRSLDDVVRDLNQVYDEAIREARRP